ncbi:MAG TPA: dihydrodipicolinate synthase family protein [bacterium]|nr:dihydrodipicolinate synthase family protein [bacterium]
MKNEFCGVYAALLTPFDRRGRIDEKRLISLVDFLLSRGIDGLYVCGGTGEGLLMNLPERKEVAELVKERVGKRATVISHIGGSLNTENAVALAEHAAEINLDAVSSIAPIYYRFSFREIFSYYRTVAESTSLPFFIYYIPATTGVFLPNEQIAQLATIRQIAGLKYTSPDFYLLQDLLMRCPGWTAFSGPDEMFLPALTMGVSGCIGSTQNVLPEIFVGIYKAFQQGKLRQAMRLQQRVTQAVSLLKRHGGMEAWKAALRCRGVEPGFCRPPNRPSLPEDEFKELAGEWKRLFPEYAEGV